ncbi:MAG TPA: YigZ family protein, partial [Flavobacteriaceae bacterium]|nr:YigZ family protein [Flavobacteriaceae bacterium]
FNYKDMNKVMRLIKEHQINIESQEMEMDCKMFLSIRKSNWPKVKKSFEELYEVQLVLND